MMDSWINLFRQIAAAAFRNFRERQERAIIGALSMTGRQWHWQSGYSVVTRLRREAAYIYAEAAFPPTDGEQFPSLIRHAWLRFRHWWHRKFVIPSERQASSILLSLWKRGLLICSHENTMHYRLRD